ncbi:uncharacterized protein [Apostichopus japonicus]|uniref:uncharacterized protein n=1 Tax=Stichopus japonicus TaxID=307972 RepID=UPI003AB3303E
MMHVKVLLLLGLCGLAFGQFHLRDNGLFDGTTQLYAAPTGFGASRITMCYTGDVVYLFEANIITTTVSLSRLISADNYATASVTRTFNNAISYPSVDCCCQYLAYGFVDPDTTFYHVVVERTDNVNVYKEYIIEADIGNSVVSFDCNTQLLRVVGRGIMYEFDISQPGVTPTNTYTYGDPLSNAPRCVAFGTSIASVEYLFVSFEDRPEFVTISLNDMTVVPYFLQVGGPSLKVSCLAIEGNTVSFFARDSSTFMGYVLEQTVDNLLSDVDQTITVFSGNFDFALISIFEFVNGLSVCTGCSGQACNSDTCNCPDASCGFCLTSDLASCVCTDSQEGGCVYNDPAVGAVCVVPFSNIDASCIVHNPVAERRSGGDVNVGFVVSPSETVGVVQMAIQRAAKTGRWPTSLLPRWQALTTSANLQLGYRMPVQPNARGRRFGIFDTVIDRDDAIVENIFCIATEGSRFRNQVFTQTCVQGSTCQLSITMDNIRFLPEVRWRRTDLITGAVTDYPQFDGSLTLIHNPVIKANHEGVYEGYRVKRYLRTWHPILYLYVRECPTGAYGALCDSTCPNCNSGICDVQTGLCRCYPGFTGTNCELPCGAANLIGQSCDINCDNIFPGTAGNDCIELEICNREDLGCQCRSGLQLPECTMACPAGTWGTNCAQTCSCTALETCDPRQGCV